MHGTIKNTTQNRGNNRAMKVKSLIELKAKLHDLHRQESTRVAKLNNWIVADYSSTTIYSLLIDLLQLFISEFHKDGEIKFSLWNFRQNLVLVVKVVRFFRALYNHLFKEQ